MDGFDVVGTGACLDWRLGGSLFCLAGVFGLLVLAGEVSLALTDLDLAAAFPRVSAIAAFLALASLLEILLAPLILAKSVQSSS